MISISFKPRASGKTTELIEISKTLSKENTILFCGYNKKYSNYKFIGIRTQRIDIPLRVDDFYIYSGRMKVKTVLLDDVIPSVEFIQFCEKWNVDMHCRATLRFSDVSEDLLKYLREHYPEEIL